MHYQDMCVISHQKLEQSLLTVEAKKFETTRHGIALYARTAARHLECFEIKFHDFCSFVHGSFIRSSHLQFQF